MTRYTSITVTAKTLRQFQASHGNWVRVGYEMQVPIDDPVDLRPFGQLRTWIYDDPPKLETCLNCFKGYDADDGHVCKASES